MGNIVSSRRSSKSKTLDHELEASPNRQPLPINGIKPSNSDTAQIPCPDSLTGHPFEQEFYKLKTDLQQKVVDYQDAIQPHTDEGGEAYYIGDAYEDIALKWASEWAVSK